MSHWNKERARNKLFRNGREECITRPGEICKKSTSKYKVSSMLNSLLVTVSNPDDGLLNFK